MTGFGAYRAEGEVSAAIRALSNEGARVWECAVTHERRSVLALEIGPPRAHALSIAMAGIHALEWVGTESLLAWLASLVREPPEGRRVLAFPLVNPDGYAKVARDRMRGEAHFRRGNARGVDLNRNWPTLYRKRTLASTLAPMVYRSGEAPLSEPETRGVSEAIDRAVAKGASDLRAMSIHSAGARVLFPYGGRWRRARDHHTLEAFAKETARVLGPPYVAVQSSRWVPGFFAPGMEIDHLYEAYGAWPLLVECHNSAAGVLRDRERRLSPFAWFNPADPAPEIARVGRALGAFLLPRGA